jgi:D-amino peptidase
MKVFISFDMEGVAGIVDWSQCRPPGVPYEEGRRLLLGEVNAAIDGALAAGATEIVCNDSHGAMNNLDPAALHGRASYVSGRHKPMYMMQGLDAGADVVFMVGYHGSISGESSVLSHTYNPSVVSHVELNGVRVGESGINALVALACRVPVGLITGDRQTIEEAGPFLADAEQVVVKESFTRFGAANLHPEVACAMIADGARRAVQRAGGLKVPGVSLPATLDVHTQTADMAEVASWVRGAERTGVRTVSISGEDPLAMFRSFVAVTYITRVSEGRLGGPQVGEPAAAPVTWSRPQRAMAASQSSGTVMPPFASSASQSSAGTRHSTSNSMPLGSLAYSDFDTRWSLSPTSAPAASSLARVSTRSASVPTSQARWYRPGYSGPSGARPVPISNRPRSWSLAEPGARRNAARPGIWRRTSKPRVSR